MENTKWNVDTVTGEQDDGQCNFYLAKKRRLCRFRPNARQKYCPEHMCIMGVNSDRKRIPCPLNPSHNCYEDDVEKHIKICNVTKIKKATEQAVYFSKGINKGSEVTFEKRKVCVKDLTSSDLASLIDKVNKLYETHVEKIERAVIEHPCVKEEICGPDGGDLNEALELQATLRKELLQQASLIGQLDKLGLLVNKSCFVELGAGKGKLSHWVQKASKNCPDNTFILVERSSVRYKMDSFHKQGGDESSFHRIKLDIEDLYLGRVPELGNKESVVVVGKHLCGGATDMGIRCSVQTLDTSAHEDLGSTTHPDQLPFSEKCSSDGKVDSASETQLSGEDDVEIHQSTTSATHDTHGSSCVSTSTPHNHSSNSGGKPAHISGGFSNDNPHGLSSSEQLAKECFNNSKECSESVSVRKNDDNVADANKEMCDPPSKTVSQQEPRRLPKGIMIALCCHHQCTWETYLGRDFMDSIGVIPDQFDLLTRLSSWATCSKITAKSAPMDAIQNPKRYKKSENIERKAAEKMLDQKSGEGLIQEDLVTQENSVPLREQLSVEEREEIGRKCKRLIDTGRLHFLRSKGMHCFLREYIHEDLTPENVVLIACSPPS